MHTTTEFTAHGFTPSRKSANAVVAFRSAQKESRALGGKPGGAIFISGSGGVL
jgi:hypothetical protein